MGISRSYSAWCVSCKSCDSERTIVDDIEGYGEPPEYCSQCGEKL